MEFEGLTRLWSEITEDSDVLDVMFVETEQMEDQFQLFNTNDDEFLRSIISKINKMLNEVKSTPKGLLLLSRITAQISEDSIAKLHDSLGSSLNLVMKSISVDPACQIFINILPKCLKQPDLQQTISVAIVPKIYEFLIEKIKSTPLDIYLELLTICLKCFPGPSLPFRNKIERIFLNNIDQADYESKSYNEIFPLLSTCGGKGPEGDRHIKDWQQMVLKFSNHLYETLVRLYSDHCPLHQANNPFIGDDNKFPGIQPIVENNVLVKISLLKRRLVNLSSTICSYLRNTFTAVKLVPASGLLNTITKMLIVNPLEVLSVQNPTKETVYFAGILPSVHQASIALLQSLINCVGTNIFSQASTIDQIFVQEFKWLIQKPSAFENVTLDLYKTLIIWLKITKGSFSSSKITTTITGILMNAIEIRKETLQLTLCSNGRKKKKGHINKNLLSASTSQSKSFYLTSTKICRRALEVLALVIPTLDQKLYDLVYEIITGTIIEFSSDSEYSNQYTDQTCRLNNYKCLMTLSTSPNFKSGVSLSLIVKLIKLGLMDKSEKVSQSCHEMNFQIETLVHPISPSLSFPITSTFESRKAPASDPTIPIITIDDTMEEDSIDLKDAFCQTDEVLIGNQEKDEIDEEAEFREDAKTPVRQQAGKFFDKKLLKEALAEFFDERSNKTREENEDESIIRGEEILAEEYGYSYFREKVAKAKANGNSVIANKKRRISSDEDSICEILPEIKIPAPIESLKKAKSDSPDSSEFTPEIVTIDDNELNFDAMINDFVE